MLHHTLMVGMDHALVLDTSNNNTITSALLRQSGACALISKATEGTSFKDGTYSWQRNLAAQAKIPFGGYVFLHPKAQGSEADFFMQYAQPKPYDIMPVIDAEVTDGSSYLDVANRIDACATRFEKKYNIPVMAYSSASFWLSVLAAKPSLKRLPFWEADYPGRYTKWFPALAAQRIKIQHGVSVKMWQWTDHFQVGTHYYDASRLFVPVSSLTIQNNL